MSDFEQIIDNPQATFTGTWSTSTFQPNFYGSDYRFANRSAFSALPRVATWTPTLPAAGEYTVSVWLPNGTGDRSPAVTYRVSHGGTETKFVLDHQVSGGYWRQLGRGPLTFGGSGGESVQVRVADVTSGTYIHADAVRFATPPPALTSAPTGISVDEGRNYVEVSWQKLDGASGYVLSRAVAGGSPEEIAEVTGTAYLDLSLAPNQPYVYTVAGINGAGLGPASAAIPARFADGAPLQAVQGLVVETVDGKPMLSWQRSFDANSYVVERAAASGKPGKVVATVGALTWTDPRPLPENYYVVRGVNVHGASALGSWQVPWFTR